MREHRVTRAWLLLLALLLALLLPAPLGAQEAPPPGAQEAPLPGIQEVPLPEKTSKEVDVGRTLLLLPSKLILAPVSLFEGGLKRTLNFVEGERLVDKLDYYIRYLQDRGIYPSAYDLGDGSGPGLGLRVRRSPGGGLCLGAAAGATIKNYQLYQASAELPLLSNQLLLATRAGFEYRPEEEFFGIGPDTTRATRSDYLLEDGFFEGATWLGPPQEQGRPPRLRIGVGVRFDAYKVSPGKDTDERSIQQVFTRAEVPGLLQSIDLVSAGFSVLHDSRDWPEVPTRGGRQRLGASFLHDTSGGRFDFYRASLELEQLLPFSTLKHVFLVRGYAEVNQPLSDNDEVPFFLLAKLGGSYRLRGFQELRFYDERAVTWSLEYRYRIWSRADAFLYVDQGEVFGSQVGFSAANIATSGGGGFLLHRFGFEHSEDIISGGPGFAAPQERLFLMLLIGGSGEGARSFLTFGAFI